MSTDNILVAIKSRPLISREENAKLKPQWNVQDKAIFQIDDEGHRLGEPYSFDHVFTELHTNSNVYDAVVEPLVKSFLNGFNSTIFAYGQTSSGKTHTMMGTDATSGIIQLAINDVFQHVAQNGQRRYLISCSYFEIYNEKINDLLDKNGQDLKIREDFCGNTFVSAKEEVVTQEAQVYELMKVGGKIRKIGCTNMNERSSRSHTIFRLTIESTENNVEHGPVQISHLNLVDLAGSERIAHTKAAGVRLKEGVNINKSLLALGNVIRLLSEGEGFINYRDSNLTRLLQHALGGNAKSLIIATITVAAGEETRSTLEFAQRAKVVKNKPIINEILSEQDKLKQYEQVTANYKNRLEKEKQRISEMEQEKEEREREILKLKQQVKLIDLFTKGPEAKKPESKIPRRHTMGYYGRVPLQTIPESKVLSSNVMQDKEEESDIKHDSDDEELLLKTSQISDYDYMKLVIEETLDDCILPVTPEPPAELPVQEADTPTSHLRERLLYLEESYLALQEFTKLEAECKEERDMVRELVKEKENLLKDVVDLNIIIKDTRNEKEQLTVKLETEMATLKSDLDFKDQENIKLAFALEQAETEKENLKIEKKQVLTDNEVLLEQQKVNYEAQLQYFSDEVARLNKQNEERQKRELSFEEEMKKLKNENDTFKATIASNEAKFAELTEKLENFEKKKEEDFEILSVSTQTEQEATESEEAMKTEFKEETEKLKEEIAALNSLVSEMEAKHKTMIDEKAEEITILYNKVHNLENEIENKKVEIEYQTREIQRKDMHITEHANTVEILQNDIMQNDQNIHKLLKQVKDLEQLNNNQSDKIIIYIEELRATNRNVVNLHTRIACLEETNKKKDEEILLSEEKIQSKDNDICDLLSKIEKLENCSEEIDSYKKEIECKTTEIARQANTIKTMDEEFRLNSIKMDEQVKNLQNEIEDKDQELQRSNEEIIKLTEKNRNLEREDSYKKDAIEASAAEVLYLRSTIINLQMDDVNKSQEIFALRHEISELLRKIDDLDNLNITKNETIRSNAKQISDLEVEVDNLKKSMQSNKEQVQMLQEDNELKSQEISKLKNLQHNMETETETVNKKMVEKDLKISELSTKIVELKKESNKQDVLRIANEIIRLEKKIKGFEEDNNRNKNEIKTRDKKISDLKVKIKDLETRNTQQISELTDTIAKLEKDVSQSTDLVNQLKAEIIHYEDCTQNKDMTIIDLKAIISALNVEPYEDETEKINKENVQLDKKIKDMKKIIADMTQEKEEEKKKNGELENSLKAANVDITRLKAEIYELEHAIAAEKVSLSGQLETRNTRHSTTSSSSTDLSPKEIRRRKRQSIHDQRRGIDLTAATTSGIEEPTGATSVTSNELQEKVKKLETKIEDLTNENESLELEVQGFIRELDDYKSYYEEADRENDMLKMELEKVKMGMGQEDCKDCPAKQAHIKKLEDLQKVNQFKIVELQTKIYDLQNSFKVEKVYWDEKDRRLSYLISRLESRLGDKPPPEVKDADVQCDLLDYKNFLEKYENTKKLARMRREEGNILRARLGLSQDAPIQ